MSGPEQLEGPQKAASMCSGVTLAEKEARTGASRILSQLTEPFPMERH